MEILASTAMRRKCSTLAALVLQVTAAWAAAPCPPDLLTQVPKVAHLRGLAGSWQPRCELLPASTLKQRLASKLANELPVEPQLFLEILQRLGFVPPTPGLYQKLLDFYQGQVLGFYEPSRDTMVVVERPLPDGDQASAVWLHELAHAAQEARFRLPTRLLGVRDNSDRQRSYSAIAEGEAMLVMLFLESPSPPPVEQLEAAARAIVEGSASLARSANIGAFFVEDLTFPYAQGLRTVLSAYRRGGWAAVDRLLANPPACTARLLYNSPCRHLPDEELPTTPKGWRVLLTDTLGAWAVRFWMAQAAGEAAAEELARAWDGDRLRIIRHNQAPERWALYWRLRLVSPEKAGWARVLVAQHAPRLLAHFGQGGPSAVAVTLEDRTLTVQVDWPAPRP